MIIYLLIVLIAFLNVIVTRHVMKDERRYKYEKIAVLPIFGALTSLCITFQNPERVREYEDILKFFKYS